MDSMDQDLEGFASMAIDRTGSDGQMQDDVMADVNPAVSDAGGIVKLQVPVLQFQELPKRTRRNDVLTSCAGIKDAALAIDESGYQKHYAYVEFESAELAAAALEQGATVRGQKVVIAQASDAMQDMWLNNRAAWKALKERMAPVPGVVLPDQAPKPEEMDAVVTGLMDQLYAALH